MPFSFDNTYARLPERFFSRLAPVPVARPRLVKLNESLAEQLGLDREALAVARGRGGPRGQSGAGRARRPWPWPMPATSSAASCRNSAMAGPFYWARSLIRPAKRFDIQLKGSGRTPFSRER